MRVDIWSDVVCPWCYIGKRRFEAAMKSFEHRDDVELIWHSYQLDPSAPPTQPGSYLTPLAAKLGRSEPEIETMLAEMTTRAADDGLEYRFDIAHHANTFDAHRLLHLAARDGVQNEVKERLLAAVFTEGRTVSDPGTLREIGVSAGLAPHAVDALLDGDGFAAEVRGDIEQAVNYGISGVPFFVIDGRYGVSGAQPSEVLTRALEQAWSTRSTEPAAG